MFSALHLYAPRRNNQYTALRFQIDLLNVTCFLFVSGDGHGHTTNIYI